MLPVMYKCLSSFSTTNFITKTLINKFQKRLSLENHNCDACLHQKLTALVYVVDNIKLSSSL